MTEPTANAECEAPSNNLHRGHWMALTAALLGWMFDGLEMGLFPLVARPALADLLGASDDSQISMWFSVATAGFLVGAATGGVLFGWLGDRVGRVRAMMLSVLTYAIFTGLCGFATHAAQIAAFRFISALGMGGEWSLGVALVMEIWPDRSRGVLAGLIGAAANVGFLLIALVGLVLTPLLTSIGDALRALGLAESAVDALIGYSGWRLLLILGAAPALLTFFIRVFVPESQRWQREHGRGHTSHWSAVDLWALVVGALAVCAMVYLWAAEQDASLLPTLPALNAPLLWLFQAAQASVLVRVAQYLVPVAVVTAAYTYPVLRYLQRSATGREDSQHAIGPTIGRMLLVACLSGVALLGTWGSLQWAALWADQLTGGTRPDAKAMTQAWSAAGAIVGTVLAAVVGRRFGRRVTYCVLCLSSLGAALSFFHLNKQYNAQFLASVFIAGGVTASFYGWLPLYLPELFRTRVRATGQGFAFNFGRIIAAIGVLQTGALTRYFEGNYPYACSVMSVVYLLGPIVVWFLPETRGRPLPE